MMNLNKKELKLISYDFRCKSNRLINTTYDDMKSVLKMFITYIDNTTVISEYITSCKTDDFDVKSEVDEVHNSFGRAIFELGSTTEEEISRIYDILKYISENNIDIYSISRAYSHGSETYSEYTKAFNKRVSLIFINHICDYLTKIGINMGYDEEEKYLITNNGGQVNISKDNSTLNPIQNIGTNSNELIKLVYSITSHINDSIPSEEKEIIEESVEAIQNELQSKDPKKAVIKSCLRGLKSTIVNIPTAIELCKNVEQFISYVGSLIQG